VPAKDEMWPPQELAKCWEERKGHFQGSFCEQKGKETIRIWIWMVITWCSCITSCLPSTVLLLPRQEDRRREWLIILMSFSLHRNSSDRRV
jgi:hypothetical protein